MSMTRRMFVAMVGATLARLGMRKALAAGPPDGARDAAHEAKPEPAQRPTIWIGHF